MHRNLQIRRGNRRATCLHALQEIKAKARSTGEKDSRKTRFLRMETFSSVVHVKRFPGVLKLELEQIYKAADQIVCLKEV
jgi:hypothetical protein